MTESPIVTSDRDDTNMWTRRVGGVRVDVELLPDAEECS